MLIVYLLRTILVIAALFLMLVVLGVPAVLYAAVSSNVGPMYRLGIFGARVGLRLAGIRVCAHGLEHVRHDQTYVFMANHQSHTDPPAVLTTIPRPVRVMLKKELGRVPILGPAMRLAGFVFVDRGNRESGRLAIDAAAESIRAGHSFMVYPEGTRSPDGRLGPFKAGSFIMAIKAGTPIVPITVAGSRERMPKGSLLIRPGTIDLYFHEPITTAGRSLDDKTDVLNQVRERISSKL